MTWERTFAHATAIPRTASPPQMRAASQVTLRAVQDALRAAGWTQGDLRHPSAPRIMHMVARDHADWFTRNMVVVVAEARALDLRTADPLPPRMPLWGRSRRVP